MSYSIFRISKVKNSNTVRALQRHNQRENKTYGNKDIDHSKTHLNYDLVNPDVLLFVKTDRDMERKEESGKIDYIEKIEERIAEGYQGKRKVRSDAIKLVDGIITSDKEFFDSLPKSEQEKYFKDSLDFIKNEYGEKNILYATVHLDEKTPHMHFGFVPLTEDGRLSAKDVVGNKESLSKLQDRFDDFVNEKGYGLERGNKTGAKHIEIMKFKADTLNNEVQTLKQDVERFKVADRKIKEVDELDKKVKPQKFKRDRVVMTKDDFEIIKATTKSEVAKVNELEKARETDKEKIQDLQSVNQRLEKNLEITKKINDNLRKEKEELKKENKKLQDNIKGLSRELKRYKTFVKNFGEQLLINAKKMAKTLQHDRFFDIFQKSVFNPSKDYGYKEFVRDRKEEEKELKKENEKDFEL